MTKRKKPEVLKARPVPRGRPATGLQNAVLYTGWVDKLLKAGTRPSKAVKAVARHFRKREEHIWKCRKIVADEIARRKKNNIPFSVWEE
jgi:hypothetical protein